MSAIRRPRAIILVVFCIAALALFIAITLFVANLIIMPRARSAAVREADQRGVELAVGRGSWIPFRGLVVRDIRAQGWGSVDRMRIRIPRGAVALARGRTSLPPAGVAFLDTLGDAELLPSRVVMRDVRINLDPETRVPVDATLARVDIRSNHDAQWVSLEASGGKEALFTFGLDLGYTDDTLSCDAQWQDVPVSLPLVSVAGSAGLVMVTLGEGDRVEIVGDVGFASSVWNLPAIHDNGIPVRSAAVSFAASLDGLPQPRSLAFTACELTVNGISFAFEPALTLNEETGGVFSLHIDLPQTLLQDLLGAIPAELLDVISETVVDGTLSWLIDVEVPLRAVEDLEWTAQTSLDDFAVRLIHPDVNVYELNGEFIHTIVDDQVSFRRTVLIPPARETGMEWMLLHSEHSARQIARSREEAAALAAARPPVSAIGSEAGDPTGQGPEPDTSYRYIRLEEMSPWVVRAILTAEDGDFFFYGGVNPVTLADAIALNIEAGEIRFGASTITMQLIKMLYLDQQRVFARKLQEVILVYVAEHQVPVQKDRILELYINLAEFGPGVYGIADAARHYFNKDPRHLTAGEATWLASILPSPKTYYREFEQGGISGEWFSRMVMLFDIMLERGRMTHEEYAVARRAPPAFVSPPQ